MPRDANGVYSLPEGYLAITGTTIQASQHNPPLEDIAAALTGSLPRAGTAPMTGALKIIDGNASTPGLAFASDPSIGFYKSGSVIKPSNGAQIGGVLPIGLMLPYAGSTAPPGFVLPYGQALNRVTYADLWTFAQAEIAAGNTLFNNGNGTTTFGVMDLRGRGLFFNDRMGGTPANRLKDWVDGSVLGNSGGLEGIVLTGSQTGPHTHPTSEVPHSHQYSTASIKIYQAPGGAQPIGGPLWGGSDLTANSSGALTGITVNANTGGEPHNNMPPALVTNVILYAGV